MKLLANPIVLIVLGLLAGVGTSVSVLTSAAGPLIKEAANRKTTTKKAPRPAQPWDFWTVEIEALSSELKEQKGQVKLREEAAAVREGRLVAERQELAKTRAQLEALREEIATKMIEVQADEAKNLKTLASTYSNLTPKAAVNILREMEEGTVVKVLSMMKTDQVSALFEEMGKSSDASVVKRAAVLSERIRLLKTTRGGATTASAP